MRSGKRIYRHTGEYQALAWVTLTTTREQHWPDKTGWTQLIEWQRKPSPKVSSTKWCSLGQLPAFRKSGQRGGDDGCQSSTDLNCYHFYMAFDGENAFLGSHRNGYGGGVTKRCVLKRWRDSSK